jgi:hypothetical protein
MAEVVSEFPREIHKKRTRNESRIHYQPKSEIRFQFYCGISWFQRLPCDQETTPMTGSKIMKYFCGVFVLLCYIPAPLKN